MTASHVTKPRSFSAHRQATTNLFSPNLFLFDFTAWFITASHSVAHRADSRFILLTSITITAWHKDHRRVQHTCLAYLSFQQLAVQTHHRSTETGLFTQTPGYLDWHITLQLISCCFGCLYVCKSVCVHACAYINNTQMVCPKGSCTIPTIVLFLCECVLSVMGDSL